MGELREVAAPFVVPGPAGVSIRCGLEGLTGQDEEVLRTVGGLLGSLASRDLKARCAAGLDHDSDQWARRKRVVTGQSSSRWAGSITKATHDQWALARRGQLAHIQHLRTSIDMIAFRLSLPVGAKGSKGSPGGYRSRQEWFAKARRLHLLQDRLERERADREAGRVRVVRGGKKLLRHRHNLQAARLTGTRWRERWEAGRWFLQADGESGKRCGNETIRVTPDGEVSIKLPAPLAGLANAPHGRYVLACRTGFRHRGEQWADRISANGAVAYRIHYDVERDRWYLTASWQNPPVRTMPLEAPRSGGLIGVDTNADHLAAWRLDPHGNPVGEPRRFPYDLSGNAPHRDAQVRHALIRLLHWARRHHLAIAIEDLDFTAEKTREKHGRRKSFRKLISGLPVSTLRARLVAMAAELGIVIVAVDPAYTSKWGAQHWLRPLTSKNRATTRHDAASVAIGRRALGHRIRRRTAPPHTHQSDGCRHRTAQAGHGAQGREESRPRIPGPRTRSDGAECGAKAADQYAQHRSGHTAGHGFWQQDPLPLSLQER
ncbi:IS200/IS605 family element transposase accessory protein TnpB [Streptomyces rapamycinicus]|uniref:Transposase, IS605 OrfB family protein n=2 Tax=Streptomyces rapamycinicus TaxID=1226757 RepID=A0A0A0NQW9_STRRN|nr:IS200/IS605 family element transposase accessory protein TnpB [Streptomyces rapamycinicus]AGP58638.1 transposase [Streptomyces rapamycinicus NRRL 5491]MBB4786350.1 IS605 OrfB family transposase [Streptomyces rapamycinicus]RLV78190.1 transposase, IS605 OrfB family protein [Streptomyces rapamycinicus NRRL 5491]UTO66448.1 IS200/IS605 family element transposase accessory protein TnpB [Streptomyces rapamycinicus]UTP34402.1 IS200/IS605 family element transposase accessory protein TnpB [Streptomyc